MAFFGSSDFEVGKQYCVSVRPTKAEQDEFGLPNVVTKYVGDCIAVQPYAVLLRTADCLPGQHHVLLYQGICDLEAASMDDDDVVRFRTSLEIIASHPHSDSVVLANEARATLGVPEVHTYDRCPHGNVEPCLACEEDEAREGIEADADYRNMV